MENISFENLINETNKTNNESMVNNEELDEILQLKKHTENELMELKQKLSSKINHLAQETSEIRKMAETMVYLVSLRQEIVDIISDKKGLVIDLTNIRKMFYKVYFEEEYKNNPIKLSFKVRDDLIESKLKDIDSALDTVKNYVDYLNQSLKTVDALIFFLKDRLELYKQIGS